MKRFMDMSKTDKTGGFHVRYKKHYTEVEMPMRNGVSSYTYLFPYSKKNSCQIVTCFDDALNPIIEARSADERQLVNYYFPNSIKLYDRWNKDKFDKPHLMIGEDPKDGESKWMVCLELFDLDFEGITELLDVPGLKKGIKKVYEKSLIIKNEIVNHYYAVEAPVEQMNHRNGTDANLKAFEEGFFRSVGENAGDILMELLS